MSNIQERLKCKTFPNQRLPRRIIGPRWRHIHSPQSRNPGAARHRCLRRWNTLCHEHLDGLALILTMENRKPLARRKGRCYTASILEWFAGEAEQTHGETVPSANRNQRILTIKEPIHRDDHRQGWRGFDGWVHDGVGIGR